MEALKGEVNNFGLNLPYKLVLEMEKQLLV